MKKKWMEIKKRVLGDKFNLSIAFLDSSLMKKINRRYRKKDRAAEVLSFLYSPTEGEILFNKNLKNRPDYLDYLFVHSLLHLDGFNHGKKMELQEKKILKSFKINI